MTHHCSHCRQPIEDDSIVYTIDEDIIHTGCLLQYLISEFGLEERYINSEGELE